MGFICSSTRNRRSAGGFGIDHLVAHGQHLFSCDRAKQWVKRATKQPPDWVRVCRIFRPTGTWLPVHQGSHRRSTRTPESVRAVCRVHGGVCERISETTRLNLQGQAALTHINTTGYRHAGCQRTSLDRWVGTGIEGWWRPSLHITSARPATFRTGRSTSSAWHVI